MRELLMETSPYIIQLTTDHDHAKINVAHMTMRRLTLSYFKKQALKNLTSSHKGQTVRSTNTKKWTPTLYLTQKTV